MSKKLKIIPFGKSFDEIGFTYLVPKNLEQDICEGQILEIPFGKKVEFGLLYEIETPYPLQVSYSMRETKKENELKEIISIKFEKALISGYRLELLKFIAKYYFTPIHNSLNLFLPKNLIEKVIKGKLNLEKVGKYNYNFPKNLVLSKNQDNIYKKIINSKNNKILLYGITGSGKTEIYIKLIEKYLKKEKQILLLIPEIILTNQISDRLEKVFGKDIIILNSTLSQAKKTQYFLDIHSSNAKIIIGTRSSIFYPFLDLGLIIIDEEHDNSYKSEQAPRYDTIEIAEKITSLNGNKLLIASGTPSINSMYKGLKGDYELLNLLEKYRIEKVNKKG